MANKIRIEDYEDGTRRDFTTFADVNKAYEHFCALVKTAGENEIVQLFLGDAETPFAQDYGAFN